MTQTAGTVPFLLDDADQRIASGLRMIREAPGTLYSRELYSVFGLAATEARPSGDADEEVLRLLNSWYADPLVVAETTSSRSIPGMMELVTVIQHRTFLGVLLNIFDSNTEVRVHPHAVVQAEPRGGSMAVIFAYPPLITPGGPTDSVRERWRERVIARYESITDSTERQLAYVDQAALSSRITFERTMVTVDLDNCYVDGINLGLAVAQGADHGKNTPVRLLARNSVFGGSRIELGRLRYCAFNLSWSVFTAPLVNLLGATFNFDSTLDDSDPTATVQLRDSTFCETVSHLAFDEVTVTGATRAISLEDAEVWGTRITFNRSDLGRVALGFYQTRLLGGANVEFVETKMGDSSLSFLDATLEGCEAAPAAVVFYRVSPLPASDFVFRRASEVRLENCTLGPYARFANVDRISLWRSSVSGTLLSVVPRANLPADLGRNKFWFLDALESGRTSDQADLAAEFAGVKEVFHSMGEYDLEDEAFVRHMRFKSSTLLGKWTYSVLDRVGRFGTSPKRMMLALGFAYLVFAVLDCVLIEFAPGQFEGAGNHSLLDGVIVAAATLLQASGPVSPKSSAMEAVFLLQSLGGWFFLGYLFSGFVRRTLR